MLVAACCLLACVLLAARGCWFLALGCWLALAGSSWLAGRMAADSWLRSNLGENA